MRVDVRPASLVQAAIAANCPPTWPQLLTLFAEPPAKVLQDGWRYRLHAWEVCALQVGDEGVLIGKGVFASPRAQGAFWWCWDAQAICPIRDGREGEQFGWYGG